MRSADALHARKDFVQFRFTNKLFHYFASFVIYDNKLVIVIAVLDDIIITDFVMQFIEVVFINVFFFVFVHLQLNLAPTFVFRTLRSARAMSVTSPSGTDLRISLEGAVAGGNWGFTTRPGTLTHWPGGIALAFPAAGSVNGTLVLAPGDVNLTFKRYVESAITLTIENDYVTAIGGAGLDAQLMRSYIEAWGDRESYAVSHVGYGLCDAARWDSMALYDKRDFNGTELRAFAGNFLYSTGANETAGRYTRGHFDWPMRDCTVALDGTVVVDAGKVVS